MAQSALNSVRALLAWLWGVIKPLLSSALGLLRLVLARAWVLLRRAPLWAKAGLFFVLLYFAAYLVLGVFFRLPEYSWAARVARYAFWPAEQLKNRWFSASEEGTDLSVLSVPAVQVQPEEVTPRITSVGTIEQFEKVEINAKSPGRIEKFFAREGDTVRSGQKIVQLERAFLELELKQQQAAHEAAQSEQALTYERYLNTRKAAASKFKEIEKQTTLVRKLRSDMNRVRETYAGKQVLAVEGGISQEEFAEMKNEVIGKEAAYRMALRDLEIVSVGYRDEDIKQKGLEVPADPEAKKKLLIDLNTAAEKAEVDVAKSRVKSAEAAMQTTLALLKESTIVSPIDGMVASRNKAVGEQVTGGSVSTPSQAIMVIVDIRKVYAVMTVKESDLQTLRQGMRMVFTADPYPDQQFNGVIDIINPVVDPKTHTIEVKAVLANPGQKLRPGMFIRSSIVSGEAEKMIVVPQGAVLPLEDNKGYVFVIRSGIVQKAQVQTGRQIDDRLEIKEGLKPGDIVATDKLNQLRDGMRVTPALPQAK